MDKIYDLTCLIKKSFEIRKYTYLPKGTVHVT